MIQRIQTIYLLLASVSAFVLFFVPIAWFYGNLNILEMFVCRVVDPVPSNEALFGRFFMAPLSFINLAVILVSFISVFQFKKLHRQLKSVRFAILLIFVYIAALFIYYIDVISAKVNATAEYSFGAFLPLITVVLLVFAMRSIQADIKLLKSVDRLR